MIIFNRKISLQNVPQKVITMLTVVPQVFVICKSPLSVLKHYFRRTSPPFVELRSGHKIFLSSSKHDISTFIVVFCHKDYGNISDKKIVMDIGANIGMFAMYAINSGAKKVYSFEPNKESFATIQKTISANKLEDKLLAFNLAVSSISGEVLYIPKESSPLNISQKEITNNSLYDAIPTVSINDFMNQNNLDRIDLLKIDCEGAEYEILPALSEKSIQGIKEIKLEFHGPLAPINNWMKDNNFNIYFSKQFKYIKDCGYVWAKKFTP